MYSSFLAMETSTELVFENDSFPFGRYDQTSFKAYGKKFPTLEHYYQYRKCLYFLDYPASEDVIRTANVSSAQKLGRLTEKFDPDVWGNRAYDGNLEIKTLFCKIFCTHFSYEKWPDEKNSTA